MDKPPNNPLICKKCGYPRARGGEGMCLWCKALELRSEHDADE